MERQSVQVRRLLRNQVQEHRFLLTVQYIKNFRKERTTQSDQAVLCYLHRDWKGFSGKDGELISTNDVVEMYSKRTDEMSRSDIIQLNFLNYNWDFLRTISCNTIWKSKQIISITSISALACINMFEIHRTMVELSQSSTNN